MPIRRHCVFVYGILHYSLGYFTILVPGAAPSLLLRYTPYNNVVDTRSCITSIKITQFTLQQYEFPKREVSNNPFSREALPDARVVEVSGLLHTDGRTPRQKSHNKDDQCLYDVRWVW